MSVRNSRKPYRVVIVCQANITRSPYLAAYLSSLAEASSDPRAKKIEFSSAGVGAGENIPAYPVIQLAARASDISLHRHRSRPFNEVIGTEADLILTLETSHKKHIENENPSLAKKVFSVREFGRKQLGEEDIDIADPTGGEVEEFAEFISIANAEAERIFALLLDRIR